MLGAAGPASPVGRGVDRVRRAAGSAWSVGVVRRVSTLTRR